MAKRALNGMGSIRKRKDGRYEGRYTSPDGKQRTIYGRTAADCSSKLKAAINDVDSGKWFDAGKCTMAQWLDTWLADYCGHVSGRTKSTYKWIINKRFKPAFGNIRVVNFTKAHVRVFIRKMQDNGLSPATIQHAKGILSSAMRAAVEDAEIIKINPVTGVKSPKRMPVQFTVIDRDMFPAFIEAARNEPKHSSAILLMIMTGIRTGEMMGLRWSDIDLDKETMTVNRQLYTPSRARREFRPPKNNEIRTIHLPAEAVKLLRQHRKDQAAQRIRAGADWIEDEYTSDLVFRTQNGNSYTHMGIYYPIKRIGNAIGLDLNPHDLRHSYAVAALRSGADVKTVQHNLGHQSAAMTLDIYAAYTSDAGRNAAKLLSSFLSDTGI